MEESAWASVKRDGLGRRSNPSQSRAEGQSGSRFSLQLGHWKSSGFVFVGVKGWLSVHQCGLGWKRGCFVQLA